MVFLLLGLVSPSTSYNFIVFCTYTFIYYAICRLLHILQSFSPELLKWLILLSCQPTRSYSTISSKCKSPFVSNWGYLEYLVLLCLACFSSFKILFKFLILVCVLLLEPAKDKTIFVAVSWSQLNSVLNVKTQKPIIFLEGVCRLLWKLGIVIVIHTYQSSKWYARTCCRSR